MNAVAFDESASKHIPLAGEEDDFVIQAGAVPPARSAAADAVDAAAPVAELEPARPRYKGVSDETAALLDDADDDARAEYALHMKQKHDREVQQLATTEEDLHKKTPFQSMRIWILAIALLGIIAFIVYWNITF